MPAVERSDHVETSALEAVLNQPFVVDAEEEADQYRDYPHGGGSTDAGDLSQIMPVIHPYMTGARGGNHSPQWHIGDFDAGYIAPAKTLAMMAIDLLGDGAEHAARIKAERPAMSVREYLQVQKQIFHSETFDGAAEVASAN